MQQSTLPAIPHFCPTLPTELIDQIMQETKLSKSELVQCCLISKQFLNPARKLLYRQLEMRFSEVNEEEIFVYDLGRPNSLVLPSKRTTLLLQTLQDNINLRQLPLSLYFLDVQSTVSPPVQTSRTRGQVMEDILALTSNVQKVRLGSRFSNSLYHVTLCVCLTLIRILAQADHSGNRGLSHSKSHSLKMLRITGTVDTNTLRGLDPSGRSLLSNLEVLDCQQSKLPSPVPFSHSLRVLRLPCDILPIDFSLLSSLVHLYFDSFISDSRSPLRAPDLSTLLHLQTLYVDPKGPYWHNKEETCDKLLSKMPPHKICLAFPKTVPYDALYRRLTQATPILLNEIRLPPAHQSRWSWQSSQTLLGVSCSRAGIKISFDLPDAPDEIDVFCKFLFSPNSPKPC